MKIKSFGKGSVKKISTRTYAYSDSVKEFKEVNDVISYATVLGLPQFAESVRPPNSVCLILDMAY